MPKTLRPKTLHKTLRPETMPKTLRPKTLLSKTLRPKTLRPKTLRPETLRPKTLRPKTLRPKALLSKTLHKTLRPKTLPSLFTNMDLPLPPLPYAGTISRALDGVAGHVTKAMRARHLQAVSRPADLAAILHAYADLDHATVVIPELLSAVCMSLVDRIAAHLEVMPDFYAAGRVGGPGGRGARGDGGGSGLEARK